MRILLVEDNEPLAELLTEALTAQNYAVDVATDGQAGWEFAQALDYDLIILDIMLPKLDGIGLCRKLRSRGRQALILMLTAKGTSDDKILGLDAGADDYIVKPIPFPELAARVRALLRRNQTAPSPSLEWGHLQLNPSTCEVTYSGCLLHLTPKEYALLEVFLRSPQRVYSRSALLDQLWTYEDTPGEDTVKAHIKGLRQRLKAVGAPDLIETVYGLGYRLNQAYSKVTPPASPPAAIGPSAAVLRDRVAQAWATKQPIFLARLAILTQAAQAKTSIAKQADYDRAAQLEAHKLAGSLGTFGLAAGSQVALEIETLLQTRPMLTAAQRQTLQHLVQTLQQLIEAPIVADPVACPPQILIIDDDAELTALLQAEAPLRGMRAVIAPDPQTARAMLPQVSPNIVLLDLTFADAAEDGFSLLAELAQQQPDLPVIMFTGSQAFTDRIAAARHQGRGWLQKPTTPNQIFATISQILQQTQPVAARILVVDDDPAMLDILQAVLPDWGLQVTALAHPHQFWATLEATQPDLVMLDVNMPDITGLELCQTLRQDVRWHGLPVIFLTANQDATVAQQIFAAGADDCCYKPIVASELAMRLLNRLDRTRQLRSQADQDTLTGLPNQQRVSQDLETFLQLAHQAQQPLCLAVLAIDQLKQHNDQYGYAVGDQILYQVAQQLRQLGRNEDIMARWGGAEFVIGLPGVTRRAGVERLAEMLEALRRLNLTAPELVPLAITFSCGVAQYPRDGQTLLDLYHAAKAPLSQAQTEGGDRVLPVGWQPQLVHPLPTVDVALVHPDAALAQRLSTSLATRGYHYHWFADGTTAIAALASQQPTLRTQVLLLASDLPDRSGLDVLKQLTRQKITRAAKVICLSPQLAAAETALGMGAFDYILPPYDTPILMQYLQRALGRQD
jgi:diguanylate cyclase (GGDEF)-like protein